MTPRHAALGGLALGLAIALAANLTYAIPRGGVTVGLGLVTPLVLPVVLHIRTTFTVAGWWQTAVRELATLAVAGPAAAVSYVHTYQLVLDAGEPWILAVLAPLSSDGLAGMSTLALHRLRQVAVTPAKKARPAAPGKGAAGRTARQGRDVVVAPDPAGPPLQTADDELSSTRQQVEAIMSAEGCSQRTAYRRLQKARGAA